MEQQRRFNVEEFLKYLIFGGGSVATVSFLGERWAWFQLFEKEAKRFYSFVASALIGIGAYAFLTYAPAGTIEMLTPYFMIVSSVFGTHYLGQAFHAKDKLP